MNNEQYRRQVALLIRIMPSIFRIQDFAVHGGTAINLFHQNMPRYSVDIDVTYIPIAPRETSLEAINAHLSKLKTNIERTIPDIKIIHRPDVWKPQYAYQGATVKIEVNGTKRGLPRYVLNVSAPRSEAPIDTSRSGGGIRSEPIRTLFRNSR